MYRKKQPYFTGQLAHLDGNERTKLLKQASKLRKQALARGGHKVSLGDLVAELTGTAAAITLEAKSGLVTWVGPKSARIGDLEIEKNGHNLAVGDVALYTEFEGHLRAAGIEPRRSKLARPDVQNPHTERVIVANVDAVGIVVSVGSPPLHPRLIDRYLVAIQMGGAEPILIVNKTDLLEDLDLERELEKIAPYAALDVPIFACSAATGLGLEAMREQLAGKTCAFVGHSGVGKSSIMNALYPELALRTGALMGGYGRGAHTTTWSSLFEVGGGTRLIDTPGIRSFGLGKLSIAELQASFPEFGGFKCRFRDCAHAHEPQCGVKAGVERGEIYRERYETYLRLLEEVV